MQEAKKKLAIVLGDASFRLLPMLSELRDHYDATVFALDSKAVATLSPSGLRIKIRVFENAADMPGYMRGLEEELLPYDAIIGVETSRLATFQAVRAARKFGIPLGVVVTEYYPYFYESFPNIRAIQFDICNKAEMFWATSSLAKQVLLLDNVPENDIKKLSPAVDTERFVVSEQRRQKFRDYVGIDRSDIVILLQKDLVSASRIEVMFSALKLLQKDSAVGWAKVKLMLAGSGPKAMDLKYQAHGLGLGRNVMFLQQDVEPFVTDLYAASDIMLDMRADKSDHHEDLPLHLLEAMASGAMLLSPSQSVAAEWLKDSALTYAGDDPAHLAAALAPYLRHEELLRSKRAAARQLVEAEYRIGSSAADLLAQVDQLIHMRLAERTLPTASEKQLEAIENELLRGEARAALVRIEECMLIGVKIPAQLVKLWTWRGDANYQLGNMEVAMNAYGEALKINDRHVPALRGLGMVSWQSHANEEALGFFKKALAGKADDGPSMYGLSLVFRRLGLTEEALFWLERCVCLPNPTPQSVTALAQCCLTAAQGELGVRTLERAVEALGEHKVLLTALGQLYLARGQLDEGNAMIARALAVTTGGKVA